MRVEYITMYIIHISRSRCGRVHKQRFNIRRGSGRTGQFEVQLAIVSLPHSLCSDSHGFGSTWWFFVGFVVFLFPHKHQTLTIWFVDRNDTGLDSTFHTILAGGVLCGGDGFCFRKGFFFFFSVFNCCYLCACCEQGIYRGFRSRVFLSTGGFKQSIRV